MNAKEYLKKKGVVFPYEIWFKQSILDGVVNWEKVELFQLLEDFHKQKLKSKIQLKEINFDKPIEHKENNDFSQRLFKDNEKIFRGQCKVVAEALGRGERLSVVSAIQSYNIGDLRRRIKDLKDNYGVKNITWEMKGRSKVWFLK